jgi:hypothetical protein
MTKMSPSSFWLLRFLVERLPSGYAVVTPLPLFDVELRAGISVSMSTLRGLEKRGYARETRPGIWYATDAGKGAVQEAHGPMQARLLKG